MTSSFLRFLGHTQRRTIVGRTPLDEWSARRRDLYLTTHNTHNRQTSIPPVRFEPTISAGEWPQTYALGRAATGTGDKHLLLSNQNINNTKNYGNETNKCTWKYVNFLHSERCKPPTCFGHLLWPSSGMYFRKDILQRHHNQAVNLKCDVLGMWFKIC